MNIYGNGMAVIALLIVVYIVYAIIREYTGITSWRGILAVIKMQKEERYRIRRIALTPETTKLRDRYKKISTDIRNRIDELQSRSGVSEEVLHLYTTVWLMQNMLPLEVTQKHMDVVHGMLHTSPSNNVNLLNHISQLVDSDMVNIELPVIIRQAVLNTVHPITDSDRECILLNIVSEFISNLSVSDTHMHEQLYYGTPAG